MIKIQNLTAGYGKKIILSDINLELENQTYGIIGPNGSGKTTLFSRTNKLSNVNKQKYINSKPKNLLW